MRVQKLTLAGLVAFAALIASAAPASAALTYVNICPSLHTTLCSAPKFSPPVSIAVDNSSEASSGDVWALYYNPVRLARYNASGNRLAEVETGSAVLGSAGIGRALAIDPSNGDLYLSSDQTEPGGMNENHAAEVTKFDSSGARQFTISGSETPQGSFGYTDGVAVDPTSGDLYVVDSLREAIDKFTATGKFVEQLSIATPERHLTSIALDPEGNIYVGLRGQEPAGGAIVTTQVRRYTPTGAPLNCPSANNVVYESPPEAPGTVVWGTVGIDRSDGHLFVAERTTSEGNYIAEYATPCTAPTDTFGGGGELGSHVYQEVEAIGVNTTTHEIYLGSDGIFAQATVPDVATSAPATALTHTAEMLSGVVNPDGVAVTECVFEYGATFAYGKSVPCAQKLPLEGSSPVTVSAELRNLAPSVLYHYRVRAANANGHKIGEPQAFTTEQYPLPVLGGVPASYVSQFAATLNGTIAPGEAFVDYRFEYGTSTAYGQVAPIPDSLTPPTSETLPVSQPVNGLRAGTTYHYRLVASSPAGTEVEGPDETFTTLAVPAPTASTGGASEVGVGSATLLGTIDPHGWDTTYLFEYGTSTAYGQNWPTVPVDMGALEGPQPVVVTVPNLLPDTTYHYRLVAVNGGGVSYGRDLTFTTGEYAAPAIREPVAASTLLVPSEAGKVVTSTPKAKAKKKKKKVKARRRGKRGKRG